MSLSLACQLAFALCAVVALVALVGKGLFLELAWGNTLLVGLAWLAVGLDAPQPLLGIACALGLLATLASLALLALPRDALWHRDSQRASSAAGSDEALAQFVAQSEPHELVEGGEVIEEVVGADLARQRCEYFAAQGREVSFRSKGGAPATSYERWEPSLSA